MIRAVSGHELIPDSVTFGGTYRAFGKKNFNALRQRIEEVIAMFGFTYVAQTLHIKSSVERPFPYVSVRHTIQHMLMC